MRFLERLVHQGARQSAAARVEAKLTLNLGEDVPVPSTLAPMPAAASRRSR